MELGDVITFKGHRIELLQAPMTVVDECSFCVCDGIGRCHPGCCDVAKGYWKEVEDDVSVEPLFTKHPHVSSTPTPQPVYRLSLLELHDGNLTSVSCNEYTCEALVQACYHLLRGASFHDINIIQAMEALVEEHF